MKKDAQGARLFDASSDAAAKLVARYVYPSEPEDKAVALVKASAFPADPQARIDVADIYKQIAWMKEQNLVDAGVDPAQTLDLSYVAGNFNIPK